MSLLSRLASDPLRLADEYARKGDFKRAIEACGRAGDWHKAARLAAEVREEAELVRCSLMAALGRIPEGYREAGAIPAADLLVSQKRYDLAIPLFELTWSFHRAAECAKALGDPLLAAGFYQRAGDRVEAARCYRTAGKLREALGVLEESSKTTPGGSPSPARLEEMNLLRSELLRQLGRDTEARALLQSIPASLRFAGLLEQSGWFAEAIHCYLTLGDVGQAIRVATASPDRDRLLAEVYLRSGRAAEAGHLLAKLGLTREAAEAYEAAQDWGRAAYRWEAARELVRAAEAYEKARRLKDAARCYAAAGLPERAAGVRLNRGAAPAPRLKPGKVLQAASQALAGGDKVRAASLLMQLQTYEPDFGEGTLLLSPLLIEEGFAEEALSRLRRIPASPGGEPLAAARLYWQARAHEAMGNGEAAKDDYQQALALSPGYLDAQVRLARLDGEPTSERLSTPTASPLPSAAIPRESGAAAARYQRLAGRYDVLSELGRGGMGRVYKAFDIELGETVAIKTLLGYGDDGQGEDARLLREVRICRKISHPNVVRVYDLGRFPGGLFVTMEYLEGRSLDKVIRAESPLSLERIRAILAEVARGLREAHAQGIVHRDLKPANIMVTPTRVKILDFGIAYIKGGDSRLTQAGFVMGSPMYMSPDQLLGQELDGRADLYSFGLVAYSLLAGRDPFGDAAPTTLALKQLREAPPDVRLFRPETPPAWVAFIDKLTAKSPEQRYSSAQETLEALEALPVEDVAAESLGLAWQTCRILDHEPLELEDMSLATAE